MELYDAIKTRRSVRAYQDRPVEEDKLARLLEAARLAPSGNNRQDRKFIVVRSHEARNAIAESCGQAFLAKAPAVIVAVSLNNRLMHCGVPSGAVDCAIALDHSALAATAEGLGTCWIGHFEQDACRKILGVPPTATIIEMMTLGYPADAPSAKPRKALAELISYDKFE
ncbi:MAG: nitroreductase [Planctomycetaceae bacterium]|nr:MAG: nitroreductase [Planctomycetaceae bacterium]